jgi:hypothetical protein
MFKEKMIWSDVLKHMQINIHVMATGAGAGFQQRLWAVPGSSAYLSGASFPYAQEEQEELLGFMPEHFCSEDAAVDLASAAYMKAYRFGNRPVGVGLAASVASNKEHRGDHRIHACVITDHKVVSYEEVLEKGVGAEKRVQDGTHADGIMELLMFYALTETGSPLFNVERVKDTSVLALERFFLRPLFAANGKRLADMPNGKYALMPGAFNPPHEGHFGAAKASLEEYNCPVLFETTAEPPHKDALTVQELLQRAKMLQGHDRIFTRKLPYYLDKAKAFPGHPIILGADAMVRILDPKWGLDPVDMFKQFIDLNTQLFVASREIDGKLVTCNDILHDLLSIDRRGIWGLAKTVLMPLEGQWNISSTELREKVKTRV